MPVLRPNVGCRRYSSLDILRPVNIRLLIWKSLVLDRVYRGLDQSLVPPQDLSVRKLPRSVIEFAVLATVRGCVSIELIEHWVLLRHGLVVPHLLEVVHGRMVEFGKSLSVLIMVFN